MTVPAAYAHCERVTRDRARNFHYGIRLLPPERRAALCAVYAFARRVDDVGDGPLDAGAKRRGLDACRRDLAAVRAGGPAADPVLVALADATRRFDVPLDAFDDLIDGVQMDLDGRRYTTFDDVVEYCRAVAGSIGRLSLAVFGASGSWPEATRRADALGVALQLTNILRDVGEDLAEGRVYLPAEDLDRFGVRLEQARRQPDAFSALVRFEAARAREWYDTGFALLDQLDRRSGACCAAMAQIYRRLLHRIERHPTQVLTRRMSLPAWEKAAVAAGTLVGAVA